MGCFREQLRKKEEEIRDYQDQLSAVSGIENFDDGLEKLQVDLKKAQEWDFQIVFCMDVELRLIFVIAEFNQKHGCIFSVFTPV